MYHSIRFSALLVKTIARNSTALSLMKHFLPSYLSFATIRVSFPIDSKNYFNHFEERDHDYGWPMTKLPSIRCRHATEIHSTPDFLQAISKLNEYSQNCSPALWHNLSLSFWKKIDTSLSIFQPVFCRSHVRCLVLQ